MLGTHLWASGYSSGTAGSVTKEMVKRYIENQEMGDVKEIFKAGN